MNRRKKVAKNKLLIKKLEFLERRILEYTGSNIQIRQADGIRGPTRVYQFRDYEIEDPG